MESLSRRTLLRSGAAALLLPVLESNATPAFAAPRSQPPKRLVWLTMGYGVNEKNWFPSVDQVGADYDLPPLMKSFSDLKGDVSFVQNLTNQHIHNAHSGTTNFLTCANTHPAKGVFKNSISCDQLAASAIGKDTRHSSLAIGSTISNSDGHGGRFGYASWGADGKPVGTFRKIVDLYTALFGAGGSAEEINARLREKRSSLDLLVGNAKRMNHKMSASDRDRVDEYFASIRNIETRLTKAQNWAKKPFPEAPFPEPGELDGIMEIELALDLMHAAIHSDSSRVLTYMLPTSNILKELGLKMNPHGMSHKASDPDPESPHQKRDRALAEQVARFVRKLKKTKEFDGSSLLDHCLVAYGSGLRKGHNKNNSPMLLAGHGGGGIKQGRNIVYQKNVTPVSNLWLSMLRHVGVQQETFADSNAVLTEIGFS